MARERRRRFPWSRARPIAADDGRRSSVPGSRGARLRPLVLVVDDEEQIRTLFRRALEMIGCEVREAVNGRDALRKARDEPPDLIFLDLAMPIMDGFECCRRLRRRDGPTVPIVVMSATFAAEDQCRELGANGFLPKPFELDVLYGLVREHVSGAGAGGLGPSSAA